MPTLSERQNTWLVAQVAEYIDRQRKNFTQRAVPLNRNQISAMQPIFRANQLDSARILVLNGERVGNPPFYRALVQMGFEAAALRSRWMGPTKMLGRLCVDKGNRSETNRRRRVLAERVRTLIKKRRQLWPIGARQFGY